jgi:hypothetical protein
VPRNIALYWFIPAFVKSRVGSDRGTTEDDGTGPWSGLRLNRFYNLGPTKSVAILLEVIQEGLANAYSAPFMLFRRHCRLLGGFRAVFRT